jgi:hypothetical protein
MSKRVNFMIRYGSNKMLKHLIDSGEFNDHETFPNRDMKHKAVLDKLRDTNDPEYKEYRDKRLDPRIEKADKLPEGNKFRTQAANDIATDRHASMDHLRWAVKNGGLTTITNALNNQNSNWRLHDWAFATSISRPHMGGDIRETIRRHPKTSDTLRSRIDDYNAIPASDRP